MTSESVSTKEKLSDSDGNGTSDNSSSLLCDMLEQSIKSHDTNEMLINKLQKNLKLWKLRYKRLLLNKSATKQVSNVKLKLKGFGGCFQRNNDNKLLHHMGIKCRKLQENNGELARSLADQRLDAQRHYAASISYQRELQALQEGIDEAVSSRLLEVLSEMSEPLVHRINGSIEASRQQMEQLQMARSLAVALSSAAECAGASASAGNQSEAATPNGRKGSSKRLSSPAPEPEAGILPPSSPSGSSHRQCRVLPMVMGHVLQQPRLALPKMDPATLRAAAREWRQTERINNDMDMSIIAEREQDEHSDVDESVVTVAEDSISTDEENVTLAADSPSVAALNDSTMRALPSVRVNLSDCVVSSALSGAGGEARRDDEASAKPRGRFRSSRGSDRLSLVRAQVKEIVSAVTFRSSDSFTASETSTHSDEQPSITDGDPLEGPSWLYSPNSTFNAPRKMNSVSPKGCSINIGPTTDALKSVVSLTRGNALNSDSDSDSMPDIEQTVPRTRGTKTHGKEELFNDDGSLPSSCNIAKKVNRRKNIQEKNRSKILVNEPTINCDAQKDDNAVGPLLSLQTTEENEIISTGLMNCESSNSTSVSLKRKSQSNLLSDVGDKKRRLSRRQLSRKTVSQDNTTTCELELTVQNSVSASHSDDAIISQQIDEENGDNLPTAPLSPQLAKQPDSGPSQQQTKDDQKSDDAANATTNGEANLQVGSPSVQKKRESKYRSYGSVSPSSSPNVMLRRFEELDKRGRRHTKSRGKSRENSSSADANGDRLSLNNGVDRNKRKRKGTEKALLEPQVKKSEKSDCSSLMLTSNASSTLSSVTTDVQDCQDQSSKALVAVNDNLESSSSITDDSIIAVEDVQTSHDGEDETVVENLMNNLNKKHESAVTASDGQNIASKAVISQDTLKLTVKKISTQTKKSKQNTDQPPPGCSENIGSDLDSAKTANEGENTTSKVVEIKDTLKVTTRKLSTQTKKSKQVVDLPLPGSSDNIDSDLDSAKTVNEEENTANKVVEIKDTLKVTTRKLSTQTKKSKQVVDLPLPGSSDNIDSDLDSAKTVNEEENTANKVVEIKDTLKVTTRKLSTQTKKSKQVVDLPLPGSSDNIDSDLDSAKTVNEEENTANKVVEIKDTLKVTTRKLSTQTKKSKQVVDLPLPGSSDNIDSDLDSAKTVNEEENTANKVVEIKDTLKVTTRKLSTQTKKSKQVVDLPLPGSSDNVGPDLDLQNGHEPDKTCHFNEAMEITLTDPSSVPHHSHSFNFFGSAKNKPVAELQKISNDESLKINVNSSENTFEVPKLRGRRRKKTTAVTADVRGKSVEGNTRNLKEKTEFDLSQMEATVLSIAPYKSAKLKENRPPQEGVDAPLDISGQHSEASTRRLSIVLVDVLKSAEPAESSPAIKSPSLVDKEDINETKDASFKEPAVAPPDEQCSERPPKPDKLVNDTTNRKPRRVPVQPRALSSRRSRGVSVHHKESSESSAANSEEQNDANSDAQTTPVSSGNKSVSGDPEADNSECNSSALNDGNLQDPNDDCVIDLTSSPAPSVLSFSDDENSVSDCEIILPPICGEPKSDDLVEFIDVSKLNISDSDSSSFNKPQEVDQSRSIKTAGSKLSACVSNNHIPTDGDASPSVSVQEQLPGSPAKKRGRPKKVCLPEPNTDNATSNLPSPRKESRSVKLNRNNFDSSSHSMSPPAVVSIAEDVNDSEDSSVSVLRDPPASSHRQVTAISEINSFVNDILQEESGFANTSLSDEAPECDAEEGARRLDLNQVMETSESPAEAITILSEGEPPVETVNTDTEAITGRSDDLSKTGLSERDAKAATNRVDGAEVAAAAALKQVAKAAPSGGARADECGLGGGASCHPRRATVKVSSYAEPKINKKLRRGDTISTTIYAPDAGGKKKNNAPRKTPTKKK